VESTAIPTGLVPAGKGAATGLSVPPPAILKLTIVLLAESAAYKNCPFGSMASPATVAPTLVVDGTVTAGVSSVKAPPLPIENAEMVCDVPLETYKKPAVGETARNCGFGAVRDANANGDPETGVNRPRVGSTLNTEIEEETAGEVDPWLRRNKNWPPELTPTPIGLAQTAGPVQAGVGGNAVPIGVSTPVVWSILKPETVLEVRFGT